MRDPVLLSIRYAFGLVLVLAIIAVPVTLFTASAIPVVQLPESLTAIGRSTPITVRIAAPHGMRELSAFLEQKRCAICPQPAERDGSPLPLASERP
jgi:hypothetical protein